MLRLAANNLRRASSSKVKLPTVNGSRSMITSAQKRALQKDQIGTDSAASKSGSSTPPAKLPTKTVTPPPPPGSGGGGGGGGSSLPVLAGLAAIAVGGAYYMDLIPKDLLEGGEKEADDNKKDKPLNDTAAVEKEEPAKTKATTAEPKKEEVATKSETGNRVVTIHAPSAKGRKCEPVESVGHPEGGNRVSVEKFSSVYGRSPKEAADNAAAAAAAAVNSEEVAEVPVPTAAVATKAEKELSAPSLGSSKIDEELAKAHALMKATVDEHFLKGLESLSAGELRIRVVQLSSEMNERTKWEAVRLREFLGMKEKEVGEKYMDKMQKQRFEFEDLLARRLREQENDLTKSANDALAGKDRSMESVINAAASAQQAEYEAALKSNTVLLQTELSARYEAEFGTKLAEEKASMVKYMENATSTIGDLSKRLQQAEKNLQISRNFESSSQRAHRVSAAALALAEKMESSTGAGEELAALKAAAAESSVIASALEMVPASVKSGVPTLSELQTTFDHVYTVGREAAYVPDGRKGVGAQLAGKAFASITAPPSLEMAPPEGTDEAKMSDYILNRAKAHVKLGELEQSINELDKLKGQTAFTVSNWKSAAMDRIVVEKALKVIKMECALLNKNMSGK